MSVKIAVVGTGNVARNSYLQFLSEQEDVALTYLSRTRSKAEAWKTATKSGATTLPGP